jgi:DNA-binding beta-propeller fold protein YncE
MIACLTTDRGNGYIRKVFLANGETTTISHKFESPTGIVFLPNGTFAIVSDSGANALFTINIQTDEVKHFSGLERSCTAYMVSTYNYCMVPRVYPPPPEAYTFYDGPSADALFFSPMGMAYEVGGDSVIVCDERNHALRRVWLGDGRVTTLAGRHDGCTSNCGYLEGTYLEGQGTSAGFNRPSSVALTPDGLHAVVADTYNNCIRMVNLATRITSLLLKPDGAGFAFPTGLDISPNGEVLYIADKFNNQIRAFHRVTNELTIVVGPGFQDNPPGTEGIGTAASLLQPSSVSSISADWLLIVDSVSH